MKRLKFGKNSITARLMAYFICIVLLPIVVLSLILQSAYRGSIMKIAENSARDSLDLINYNLDQQFKDYENLVYFVSRDRQLQDIGTYDRVETYNQQGDWQQLLNQLLNGYRTSVDQVVRIGLSYENGIFLSTDQQQGQQHDPKSQKWYEMCRMEQSVYHVFHYMPLERIYQEIEPVNMEVISVCGAMHDKNGKFIGAIHVEMYSQILEKSMSNILSRNGAYVYVLSEDGKVVYSPVAETIPKLEDKEKYCTVSVTNKRNHWEITGVVPMESYLREIEFLKNMMVVILLIITVFMGLVSLKVGVSIVRPISTLRTLMKEAQEGNLEVSFHSRAPEEIADLGESFNVMIRKLDRTIKQVYMEQKAKRKAEIAALQANIKPHFLYNTLDTIHWMAKAYKAVDIVETVDALSTLFRISLSKGSDTIPIRQEISHVTSYLQIQKVRYEDLIEYHIQAADDCKDFLVQKLILQPIVENSIYHGIKESGRVGKIEVKVWREGNELLFSVEDNGIGMSKERLQMVRDSLVSFKPQKSGAYGIVNVHQRIVLNYGAPFGLYVESEENMGTTVIIRHPVLWEENNDTSVDS